MLAPASADEHGHQLEQAPGSPPASPQAVLAAIKRPIHQSTTRTHSGQPSSRANRRPTITPRTPRVRARQTAREVGHASTTGQALHDRRSAVAVSRDTRVRRRMADRTTLLEAVRLVGEVLMVLLLLVEVLLELMRRCLRGKRHARRRRRRGSRRLRSTRGPARVLAEVSTVDVRLARGLVHGHCGGRRLAGSGKVASVDAHCTTEPGESLTYIKGRLGPITASA